MDAIIAQWPRFLAATWLTIWMFALVSLLSTVLGAALALTMIRARRWMKAPLAVYSWVFRGLPELVVLLACYLALPMLGIDLGSIGAAILGFTLVCTAFQMEIFRSGLAAVDPRIFDASRALGMSWPLMMRRIVMPQVLRIVIAPWVTFLAGNVKAFALASAVSVTEIMMVTRQALSVSNDPFTLILFAGAIYASIASLLMIGEIFVSRYMNQRYGHLAGGER